MARKKDIPRVQNPPEEDGHHITSRYMTASELAAREAAHAAYEDMLARQQAHEHRLGNQVIPLQQNISGCVFVKSCKLPNGVINDANPSGFIPVGKISDYGTLSLLAGRERDSAGNIALKTIGATSLQASIGAFALGSSGSLSTSTAAASTTSLAAGGVVAGGLLGLVALLWPSSLADSALYTEEQLQSLETARTRVRLHVEQQPDGTLKGYGYNTQTRSDWEMIPVVQFVKQGASYVADFGNGSTLFWTASIDSSHGSGIPPLEGAPPVPHIWVYPPTEQADKIIVNPVYPPEYQDFILVFPADSGIKPLYIALALELDAASYHGKKDTPHKSRAPSNGQKALESSVQVKPRSARRIGVDPDANKLVVFDRTVGEVYHGRARPWDKLHQDMKNALIKARKVDSKGNILGARK